MHRHTICASITLCASASHEACIQMKFCMHYIYACPEFRWQCMCGEACNLDPWLTICRAYSGVMCFVMSMYWLSPCCHIDLLVTYETILAVQVPGRSARACGASASRAPSQRPSQRPLVGNQRAAAVVTSQLLTPGANLPQMQTACASGGLLKVRLDSVWWLHELQQACNHEQ